jgi:predicted nucleic acid-binding protein
LSLYVVDASVAVKWFLPARDEPFALQAKQLLQGWTEESHRLLVPDLFLAEVATAFSRDVRTCRGLLPDADFSLGRLEAASIPAVPSIEILKDAFTIAVRHDRTLYDSLYVALAASSEAQLITADEKLVNALAGHYPIRWLGTLRY